MEKALRLAEGSHGPTELSIWEELTPWPMGLLADTQVFHTLPRFADEGVISDPAGPVRDGRKCITVMTTNAGQQWLRDHLRSNPEAHKDPDSLLGLLFDAAMKELRERGFRPELLGRLDERITFLPFSIETCRQIVDSVLKKEVEKFENLKEVTIEVTEEARDVLAQRTFERTTDEGARGAPRVINELIVTPAIDILSHYEEQRKALPSQLIAVKTGMSNIVLEVAE